MKIRTLVAVVAAMLVVLPFAGAEDAPAYAAPIAVGADEPGDWGGGGDNGPVGAALGQDLTGASIGMPTADTVNFVISLASLPANGGVPEVSRYNWALLVDGNAVELDGKWTNYSRGACDPTAGGCPPPRDPGTQPFFVRGNCSTNAANVTTCQELGLVKATFDATAKTITVPVPAALIKANPCSIISAGEGTFGGAVAAMPSAFVSSTGAPSDNMFVDYDFQVPSADPAVACAPAPAA